MKLLHVYKSEPDDVTRRLAEAMSEGHDSQEFELYGEDVDYDRLVALVFENDRVVCWW